MNAIITLLLLYIHIFRIPLNVDPGLKTQGRVWDKRSPDESSMGKKLTRQKLTDQKKKKKITGRKLTMKITRRIELNFYA